MSIDGIKKNWGFLLFFFLVAPTRLLYSAQAAEKKEKFFYFFSDGNYHLSCPLTEDSAVDAKAYVKGKLGELKEAGDAFEQGMVIPRNKNGLFSFTVVYSCMKCGKELCRKLLYSASLDKQLIKRRLYFDLEKHLVKISPDKMKKINELKKKFFDDLEELDVD